MECVCNVLLLLPPSSSSSSSFSFSCSSSSPSTFSHFSSHHSSSSSSQLLENGGGETGSLGVVDIRLPLEMANADLLAKEKEMAELRESVMLLREQLEKVLWAASCVSADVFVCVCVCAVGGRV